MTDPATIPQFVEEKREQIERLCRQYSVTRLELFGSAVDGTFDAAKSDLDFLVEFDRPAGTNAFHQYFDFRTELSRLFGRGVDLVVIRSMQNLSFVRSVDRSRKLIYAA